MEQNKQTSSNTGQPGNQASHGKKITPFLWFNGNLKEAIGFYTSVFRNTQVMNTRELNGPEGSRILTAAFEIEGQQFMALDGGPAFSFNPAVSFFIRCKDQEEVDALWNKLSDGGAEEACGWLRDKFGLSWQVIPDTLERLLNDPDPVKANNVMQAMLQMKKIDIRTLEEAYNKA